MTTELANVQYRPTELSTERIGQVLVKSGFFTDVRDEAKAIVKVLAGRELGFGPIASMQGVHIINGRISLSANMVGAAIKKSGRYDYRVASISDDSCHIKFFEHGKEIGESTFTLQDATKAELTGPKSNYTKFPRNMLFARALTNGARWYCPDVFNGPIYTPDELGATVNDSGEVIDVSPASQPAQAPQVDEETGEVHGDNAGTDPMKAALEGWHVVEREATKMNIAHKQLPADADLAKVRRWTDALIELVLRAKDDTTDDTDTAA